MHLEMNGVGFSYGSVRILDDVGITLEPSQIMGILGPNGSGKTTMMRCINRILTPQQGSIMLNGEDIRAIPRSAVARGIAYVPQNASAEAASPEVFEVVLMGRRPYINWEFSEEDCTIAWEAMREMGVQNLASKDFSKLSSGQAQRVLIARALAQKAEILLLDEPTSNLDVKYQLDVMNIVTDLVRDKGISVCSIIHDLDLALRYCDKAVLLNDGRIVAAGKITDVLTSENISTVYGVDAVVEEIHGRPRVVIL